MGKIISNFFISLDGVVESPEQWHFPYFNDEMGAVVEAGMEEQEAFLMGRVLYGEWSEYWTQQGPEVPFSSFINEIPKYVVSNSLTETTWKNTQLISGDVAAGIKRLKEETPGGIGMSGSATTVRWLLANGLLDELRLLVHPIAVGKGRRLFEDSPTQPLKLLDQETLSTGVLYLAYGPA
jgi:dihydrofolate reductase